MSKQKKPLPPGKLVRHTETGSIGRTLPEVINPVKVTMMYGHGVDGKTVRYVQEVVTWGPRKHLVAPDKLKHIGYID